MAKARKRMYNDDYLLGAAHYCQEPAASSLTVVRRFALQGLKNHTIYLQPVAHMKNEDATRATHRMAYLIIRHGENPAILDGNVEDPAVRLAFAAFLTSLTGA